MCKPVAVSTLTDEISAALSVGGIIAAALVVLVLLIGIPCLCLRRWRRRLIATIDRTQPDKERADLAPLSNVSQSYFGRTLRQMGPSRYHDLADDIESHPQAVTQAAHPRRDIAFLPSSAPDAEQASKTATDAGVLTYPDPARDVVRDAQERAFAKLGHSSAHARAAESAAVVGPAASTPALSSTTAAAGATAGDDLRGQLSLLRRNMLEQQLQIDQMRAERLAEEQRQQADARSETASEAPPAYEGGQ
jgi:hypothetical protein